MTPEYRKWRNVWWGALGPRRRVRSSTSLWPSSRSRPEAKFGLLIACYIFLGIGMYVDWRKVRPARDAAHPGDRRRTSR